MSSQPPPQKRTGRPFLSCSAVALLTVLVLVGPIIYQFIIRGIEARSANATNRNEAQKIIVALERYRALHRRYPENLNNQLSALGLRFTSGTRLLYSSTADGQRYWVGLFPHRIATLLLPADDYLMEFDSQTRSWDVVYRGDAHAKNPY